MIKSLYARFVHWLIAPALEEQRRCEARRATELDDYWRARGYSGGHFQAAAAGVTGPDGRAICTRFG